MKCRHCEEYNKFYHNMELGYVICGICYNKYDEDYGGSKMKIAHVSHYTRAQGVKGGVEKFAWYLQKAINCDLISEDQLRTLDKAKYDIVIADGYYVADFNPDKQRVISVVHGSWHEFAIRNNKVNDFQLEINRQHKTWVNPKIEKVAVSDASAKYLKMHNGVEANKVILNAVDTSIFVPVPHENKVPLIIYAANDYNKEGQGKLSQIAKLLRPEFEFEYLDAKIGEEHIKFARGDMFLQTSFYEGCSYALNEALSCGLPIVGSSAGLLEDTVFEPSIGEVVDWKAPAEVYVEAIRKVWNNRTNYKPREWAVKNVNIEKFNKEWKEHLGLNF